MITTEGIKRKAQKNIALDLYDGAFLLGRLWTFQAWRAKFRPGRSEDTAARAWDRLKARFVKLGVQFELVRPEEESSARLALAFPSTGYCYAVADAVLGPAVEEDELVEVLEEVAA